MLPVTMFFDNFLLSAGLMFLLGLEFEFALAYHHEEQNFHSRSHGSTPLGVSHLPSTHRRWRTWGGLGRRWEAPMNSLPPSHMTPAERRAELCRILAAGLTRLHARQSNQGTECAGHRSRHFKPGQRGPGKCGFVADQHRVAGARHD